MTDYAAEAARLQAESERLRAECALLRAEAARVGAVNRTLQAQLALAEAERDRLRRFMTSVERSKPWRAVQALRAIVGRRW
ncbi:MAG TPA: hypothetical protein VFP80_13140 [Thermoanaerobaculia bacterium]|nr:hypothetical protein [Thermoanaerobaculia bacterium]